MKFLRFTTRSLKVSLGLAMMLGLFQIVGVAQFQNFDSPTAPALPVGWTSVQTTNTGISWRTTTTLPNSAPNAAFGNETTTRNAAALVSPPVTINSASARIGFRNRFNLEDSTTTTGVGFDGTVLDFSTDGGTVWTDVITGGGSFVSGGYTDTIATGFQSPIAGRMAWSGNSGGYIYTVINLPASLNGQNVLFRWLTASDSSAVAAAPNGQWVDDVQIIGTTTAANVSISGRVWSDKTALARANVSLTDASGTTRTVRTNSFGIFQFDNIVAGETVIIQVTAKGYAFAPQIVTLTDDLTDLNFSSL